MCTTLEIGTFFIRLTKTVLNGDFVNWNMPGNYYYILMLHLK